MLFVIFYPWSHIFLLVVPNNWYLLIDLYAKYKRMRIGIFTELPHQLYLCKVQSYIFLSFFIKLNFTDFTNFDFLILVNEDLICGYNFRFKRLKCLHCRHSYANSLIYYKIPYSWCNNVNFTKNSISYKIRTFPPISAKFLKENYWHFVYNYGEVFGSKLEFRGAWSENALLSKNSKFYKIWMLRWIFYKFNPNRPLTL